MSASLNREKISLSALFCLCKTIAIKCMMKRNEKWRWLFKSQLLTFARNSHFFDHATHKAAIAIANQRPICLFVCFFIFISRVVCVVVFLSCQSIWLPVCELIFSFSHTNLHCCDLVIHTQITHR